MGTEGVTLDHRMYSMWTAAYVLGLRTETVCAWLDGTTRGVMTLPPVIREASTGDAIVTWGEFLELAFLREHRMKGVPLRHFRPFIGRLREELETPYPLATAEMYVQDTEMVRKLQEQTDLPEVLATVGYFEGPFDWSPEVKRFWDKVGFSPSEYEDCIPEDHVFQTFLPAGSASPVVVDPLRRFGRPMIHCVVTEYIWELYDAGETIAEIAKAYERYDIDEELVRAAVSFEEQKRLVAV